MINMVKFAYQICRMPEPPKRVPVNPKLKDKQQNKQTNLTEGYKKGGNK